MQNGKSRLLKAVKALRAEIYGKVRQELADESRTYREVAEANGLSVATVQRIATSAGIERQVGPKPKPSTSEASDGNK